MVGRVLMLLLMAAGSFAGAQAEAYHPDFDPRTHKGPAHGMPSEVLVLGTAHLSGLPSSFRPEALAPLIDRLAAFHPQAITVEAISGAQCDFLRAYPDRYRDTINDYCWDPAPARAATGLSVPQATAQVDKLLATWPATPTPAQRRHLAALFLASADRASALVQWLRLPDAERHAGDGLDTALVVLLNMLRSKHDETMLIAAPLAARMGLERVYPIDDHSADAVVTDDKAYGVALTGAWTNPASMQRKAMDDELYKGVGTGDGLLALYRAYNAPGSGELVFRSDFGAAMEEPSPQQFGRGYLGYWETRNLRMAANIRDMLGMRPGIRALVIVGASHKPYLEAYLDEMHDVRLIDAEAVLR